MMTLLIYPSPIPLTINLPSIEEMSPTEFYDFCQANQDLRIERTATGIIAISTKSKTENIRQF
jgi:Uma2 family endonuclease